MKKKVLLLGLLLSCTITFCFAQAKKPTLMVIPSDSWCSMNGYMTTFDNQGVMEAFPDYEKVMLNSIDMKLTISKIGELMADRGFMLKDLNSVMKSLRNEAAEESLTASQDGDGLAESAREKFIRVAKSDILIEVTYNVNKVGPKYSLTYNIQGIDAYTFKQIAAASGTGVQVMNPEFMVLLQRSIVENMGGFVSQLDDYFDNLFEQGREISLTCRAWANGDVNFETEYDGEELGFLIEEWLAENTVEGRFSTSDASENRMIFDQVRIPLMNERGRSLDTRNWANNLRKWLKEKYSIEAKLQIRGLGNAILIVGAK